MYISRSIKPSCCHDDRRSHNKYYNWYQSLVTRTERRNCCTIQRYESKALNESLLHIHDVQKNNHRTGCSKLWNRKLRRKPCESIHYRRLKLSTSTIVASSRNSKKKEKKPPCMPAPRKEKNLSNPRQTLEIL